MQTFSKRKIVTLLLAALLMFSYSVPAFADGITSVQFFIGDSSYFLNASPAGVNMDVAPYVDKSSGRTGSGPISGRRLGRSDQMGRWHANSFREH